MKPPKKSHIFKKKYLFCKDGRTRAESRSKAKEHSLKKNLIGNLKEQALGMRRKNGQSLIVSEGVYQYK
jgi:hypothetical protein